MVKFEFTEDFKRELSNEVNDWHWPCTLLSVGLWDVVTKCKDILKECKANDDKVTSQQIVNIIKICENKINLALNAMKDIN